MARQSLFALFRRLRDDLDGNILMMAAIGLTTLCFAFGFVVDFSQAEARQTQLNAIADAASLATVDPSMIYKSDAIALAAATAMWNSQVATLSGVTNVTMTPSVVSGSLGVRNVTITWTANSTNIFANMLGATSLALSGTASTAASQPPNMNFYVVVDNSPSMLIPSSAAGIASLQATTATSDGGCAFTCHNRQPQTSYAYTVINASSGTTKNFVAWVPDSPYVSPNMSGTQYFMWVNPSNMAKVYDPGNNVLSKYAVCGGSTSTSMATTASGCLGTTISGQWADGYWAVENYSKLYPGNANIQLRIDDASNAVQQLIPYAYSTSQTNNATYGIQALFFNNIMSDPQNLYPSLPSGISYVSGTPVATMSSMTTLTSANSLVVPTIPVPRWNNSTCVTSGTCPNNGTGAMSDFKNMFAQMNTLMPNPGNGTVNSTPQEVLFLITDGYDDDFTTGNRSKLTSYQLSECTAIKTRGIKIAIIYTQYLASSVQTIYPGYAAVLTPTDQVSQALQSCASSNSAGTPLFYAVTQGQSIVPALQQLFASAVQSAYIVN